MKARFLTIILLVVSLSSAMAQTEKGNRLMGVNVGNIIIPSGSSTTLISLQPTYGWFVANNLVVGAGIPFFYAGTSGNKVTQIGLAPFLRYYFGPSQVKPFLGASIGVINTSVTTNGSSAGSSTDAAYSATGGVAFFINRSVSFDLGVTYTGGDAGSVNSLIAGSPNALIPNVPKAINISLGFQVYFGK
ncbi:outer membrane beta-barrel protein [Spirosoma foliorum]|uniref:Outer membrane beta-barrel protein n=1 Tax=Spirosoma foliorum TaxID=2710596 RepID=A0A7G5GQN7_9BACT|nr:outer membrane beta-barrel protein [Spirosoma foliorum]QMW01179.1 outer membrane beta-barrel protein [Spirosoma foliorum]